MHKKSGLSMAVKFSEAVMVNKVRAVQEWRIMAANLAKIYHAGK